MKCNLKKKILFSLGMGESCNYHDFFKNVLSPFYKNKICCYGLRISAHALPLDCELDFYLKNGLFLFF